MTNRQHILHRLQEAGFVLDAFTEEQQEVLEGLSPQELSLLLDIKNRLDEVGPEVQAHAEIAGGALF
ncbi:aroma-sacti cluster domain-containing protein [Streptomyces sp. NPDC001380]|uniref:aroma-sacti cluster domain-containing protein n=1 Tax=Streptomyces sp. NPDC001380 TaxID=3364566 RepID=UPI0036C5DF7D